MHTEKTTCCKTKPLAPVALAIVLVSMLFLLLDTYANLHLLPAWVIYSAFFAGAWYNGNFEYFYRFLKKASPGEGKVRNV